MERKYKALVWLFLAITIISFTGFYKTYFQYFPRFENISIITHLHFIIFLSWFIVLIAQPILIKQKKYALHRKVGKLTYFLAPIMVISILVMIKSSVSDNLLTSKEGAAIAFTGAILDAIMFSLFYVYSIINKNRVRQHVVGIIGASLIILNPGLGRLVGGLANQEIGILAMVITPFLVSFGIIFFEKIKLGKPILKNSYFLIPGIWLVELVLFIVLPQQIFWMNFIEKVATY